MLGPVGADDLALEQAKLAQLASRAWQDSWRARHGGLGAQLAARPASDGFRPGPVWVVSAVGDASSANGVVKTTEAERASGPNPVPPPRSARQRMTALDAARLLNNERKKIREQLRQGGLSLDQALAQDGVAARGMRVATVVRALPGIGAATATRLVRESGIDDSRRAGALTPAQRERLLGAVTAMHAIPGPH